MSGVDDVRDGLTRPRRAVVVLPSSTLENVQNVEPSILASLSDRHRQTKGEIKFDTLNNMLLLPLKLQRFFGELPLK